MHLSALIETQQSFIEVSHFHLKSSYIVTELTSGQEYKVGIIAKNETGDARSLHGPHRHAELARPWRAMEAKVNKYGPIACSIIERAV